MGCWPKQRRKSVHYHLGKRKLRRISKKRTGEPHSARVLFDSGFQSRAGVMMKTMDMMRGIWDHRRHPGASEVRSPLGHDWGKQDGPAQCRNLQATAFEGEWFFFL